MKPRTKTIPTLWDKGDQVRTHLKSRRHEDTGEGLGELRPVEHPPYSTQLGETQDVARGLHYSCRPIGHARLAQDAGQMQTGRINVKQGVEHSHTLAGFNRGERVTGTTKHIQPYGGWGELQRDPRGLAVLGRTENSAAP